MRARGESHAADSQDVAHEGVGFLFHGTEELAHHEIARHGGAQEGDVHLVFGRIGAGNRILRRENYVAVRVVHVQRAFGAL